MSSPTLHSRPSASYTNRTKNAGEAKKNQAQLENEASHATAKIGNYSASSSGAITKDDPNRTEGSWNQTIGSAKEAIGGLVGSEVCLPNPLPPSILLTVFLIGLEKSRPRTKRSRQSRRGKRSTQRFRLRYREPCYGRGRGCCCWYYG
jgi:hypothetical protein